MIERLCLRWLGRTATSAKRVILVINWGEELKRLVPTDN